MPWPPGKENSKGEVAYGGENPFQTLTYGDGLGRETHPIGRGSSGMVRFRRTSPKYAKERNLFTKGERKKKGKKKKGGRGRRPEKRDQQCKEMNL